MEAVKCLQSCWRELVRHISSASIYRLLLVFLLFLLVLLFKQTRIENAPILPAVPPKHKNGFIRQHKTEHKWAKLRALDYSQVSNRGAFSAFQDKPNARAATNFRL